MDKKMFRMLVFVLLFGSILIFSVAPLTKAADKNKPKTLDNDPNLAGWWKFDKASGKTAPDSSKHGGHNYFPRELTYPQEYLL